MRRALTLPPTYDCLSDSQDAYLHPLRLRPLARESGRYWSFHSIPTTVALPGNRYAKSLKGFSSHNDEESFRELLREYADAGCPRPSSYADVFHEKFRSPRVSWSVNALLAPVMAGGWQAALVAGAQHGTHYRYDMRSAYLWAATLGLPDTRTYTRSISPWRNGGYDGIYRVRLLRPVPGAPFPFDRAMECLASNLEIETYNLPIAEIVDGVIWTRTIDASEIMKAIQLVSTWKLAGRSYWGRWAQLQRVRCTAKGHSWDIPSITLNIPWAHMIVSRVKMRLWEHAARAAHVFVDSVITRDVLPTGPNLGDWRLEKIYESGVIIRAPGQYGSLEEARLERMAGVPINSPLRGNPAAVA